MNIARRVPRLARRRVLRFRASAARPWAVCTRCDTQSAAARALAHERHFSSAGMDAFMDFEREMALKRQQQQPQQVRTVPLTPPIKPEDDECCKLDCPNCVLLVYHEKLLEYELSLQATSTSARPAVPPLKYNVSFLDDVEPTGAQRELLEENERMVYTVADNQLISKPHQTKDQSWKSVRHIDMHVGPTQQSLVAQDSSNIAVFAPNTATEVDRVIMHLKVDPDLVYVASDADVDGKHSLDARPFGHIGSVRDALTWLFDLTSTPRSSFLHHLATYATEDADINTLMMPNAIASLLTERNVQTMSIADVLDCFPSVCLDFNAFFQLAPLNAARYYTVSSSRRFAPDVVSITLGLREIEDKPMPRCSTYLSAATPGVDRIRASFFRSSFVFPWKNRRPVLMVSAGTGIAPFRAFLQDLRYERSVPSEEQTESTPASSTALAFPVPRKAYLFYGCRDPAVDFLYREDIEQAHSDGVLTALHVEFSARPNHDKRYVQDALMEQQDLLHRHLVKEGGYIYICGSLAMGREAKRAIVQALASGEGISDVGAKALLSQCLDSQQIVTELW